MSTFDAIFNQFKTSKTIEVQIKGLDCAFELLGIDSWGKTLYKMRGKLEEQGKIKKKIDLDSDKKVFVAKKQKATAELEVSDSDFMLDSTESDIAFFIEHVLCGWSGVFDENNVPIEFSLDNAKKYFNADDERVYKMVRMLWLDATKEEQEVTTAIKK